MKNRWILCALLLAMSVAELLLYTGYQNIAGIIISPLLILAASLSVAFLSLRLSNIPVVSMDRFPKRASLLVKTLASVLFAGLSVWIAARLHTAYRELSMYDTRYSDVILHHQHIVQNFISGKPAYEPFTIVNYTLTPSYLPFQWMPYIIAEYLHFDYRWVATGSLWLASLYFFLQGLRSGSGSAAIWRVVVPLWPLVIYAALIHSEVINFQLAMESLSASYYLLLATAVSRNKWKLVAVSLAICMLSRMSIALWVPLCVACYFVSGERKKALAIAITCALFLAVFYLPFVLSNASHLLDPYNLYFKPTEDIWARNALMNGLSFNSWGMQHLPGDVHHKLVLYNRIHLGVCATAVLLMGLYYFKWRKYELSGWLLFSLKVYLTVFYTFIQLPFSYLFIIPLMVTAALLYRALLPPKVAQSS